MRTKIGLMVALAAVALTTFLVREGAGALKDLKQSYDCVSATNECSKYTPTQPTCTGLWTNLNHDCKDANSPPPSCYKCGGGNIAVTQICVAKLSTSYVRCVFLDGTTPCGSLILGICIPNDPVTPTECLCDTSQSPPPDEDSEECNFFQCEGTAIP